MKRSTLWILAIVIVVIVLSQLACSDGGGIVDQSVQGTKDTIREVGGDIKAGKDAVINDTVNILTPRFCTK